MMMLLRRNFHTLPYMCGKFHNPKVSATMSKNFLKNMEKNIIAEINRNKKELQRKGPKTVPKHPILYDTNRTKVFNRHFFESIALVMSQIPELQGIGISLTRVNVKSCFSEVRVFWICNQDEEHARQLLEEFSGRIRKDMSNTSGIGRLPRINFVMDNDYLLLGHMDRLFENLNTGPPETASNERVVEDLMKITLKSDCGGLRRDDILREIEKNMMKARASHRFSEEDVDGFQSNYRESININSTNQKAELKANIRQFLVSRKKSSQKTRTENQTNVPIL